MERAAFLSNELPRRGGPSPQARWDARAAITPEARAAFLQTLQEERARVLEDLGLLGKSELSTLEERKVERHSIRRARRARLPQFPEKDNSSTGKVSKSGHEVTGNTASAKADSALRASSGPELKIQATGMKSTTADASLSATPEVKSHGALSSSLHGG